MDTGTDYIQPELLNILFFQQKNLVIFPYVDLKHLRALELFAVGHNISDIDSQALHTLINVLEVEADNSYSQTPNFYFIYNLTKERIQELMEIDSIRCVLNTNESIQSLANGENFIFYNKKNKKFINYSPPDLEFEKELIASSRNTEILLDKIQEIKSKATQIFAELNEGNYENISRILSNYREKYWDKILTFVERYYDNIIIPRDEIKPLTQGKEAEHISQSSNIQSFSHEYKLINNSSKYIRTEFLQLLNEYREKKVNPSNLEMEELYNPQKLYDYLRNHHWKAGIPEEFMTKWVSMEKTNHRLTESDYNDFELISEKLNIHNIQYPQKDVKTEESINTEAPPPSIKDFPEFKAWILGLLEKIENKITI